MMFTDMVGSTELILDLNDSQHRDLFRRYEQLTSEVTEAEHGRFVNRSGDGTFSVFPSARAAMRAAIELRSSVDRTGAGLAGKTVKLRIGLHTGDVLIDHESVSGVAVYRAARIAEGAGADEILVSTETRDAAGDLSGFRFGPRAEIPLKGFPRSQGIHELEPLPPPPRSNGATRRTRPLNWSIAPAEHRVSELRAGV
jgi:class 3 adenylate cyclase